MRISIIVELPDLTPSDRAASKIMDELEAAVRPALDHIGHYWWLDMEGGETRYAPVDSDCPHCGRDCEPGESQCGDSDCPRHDNA
jgi:hypothetical protein